MSSTPICFHPTELSNSNDIRKCEPCIGIIAGKISEPENIAVPTPPGGEVCGGLRGGKGEGKEGREKN